MDSALRLVHCYRKMRYPPSIHASLHKSNARIHSALLRGRIRHYRHLHCQHFPGYLLVFPSRLCMGQVSRKRQVHRPSRLCTFHVHPKRYHWSCHAGHAFAVGLAAQCTSSSEDRLDGYLSARNHVSHPSLPIYTIPILTSRPAVLSLAAPASAFFSCLDKAQAWTLLLSLGRSGLSTSPRTM